MGRTYSLPVFNIAANIWQGVLPDDLTTWDGLVPSDPPDVSTVCQLYYPRYGQRAWLHALADSCFKSLLNAGLQELRFPLGVDTGAPWGVATVSKWSDVPLCECPSGSGRLYVVTVQEVKHAGFPNAYGVALLAQISKIPPSPPPPPPTHSADMGLGLGASAVVDSEAVGAMGLGLGMSIAPLPPPILAELGLGLGAGAGVLPPPILASMGLGLGGARIDRQAIASLGLGLGVSDQELFPYKVHRLGLGLGESAGKTPPGIAQSMGLGLGMAVTVTQLVFVNPCASAGMPLHILATCTAQSGSLSGWVGQNVVLTYNPGPNNWTGTLSKGGHSGTMTFAAVSSSTFTFAGNSGLDWSVSAPLTAPGVTCGPPFSATQNGGNTTEGPNFGTTSWSFQPH